MLIITNGDNAVSAIKNSGISAEFLPWRDVLHDGPVPGSYTLNELSKIRAKFISDLGWGEFEKIWEMFKSRDTRLSGFINHEEVILWFEHDLYDQLQLLQILAWFSEQNLSSTQLKLICKDEYVSKSLPDRLLFNFEHREEVDESTLQLGKKGWEAFCCDNPKSLQELIKIEYCQKIPFIKDALIRFLEEYPNINNGLSRSENQILKIVESGIIAPKEMFQKFQEYEEPKYLGNYSFFQYVKNLMERKYPLLMSSNGEPFISLPTLEKDNSYQNQNLILTEYGVKVLNGELNNIDLNGIDKWLGGVHLTTENVWSWDAESFSIV